MKTTTKNIPTTTIELNQMIEDMNHEEFMTYFLNNSKEIHPEEVSLLVKVSNFEKIEDIYKYEDELLLFMIVHNLRNMEDVINFLNDTTSDEVSKLREEIERRETIEQIHKIKEVIDNTELNETNGVDLKECEDMSLEEIFNYFDPLMFRVLNTINEETKLNENSETFFFNYFEGLILSNTIQKEDK